MALFGFNRNNGKGISKEDVEKTGPSLYFDLFFRKFWDFLKLDIIYLIASIPSILVLAVISSVAVTILAQNSNINVFESSSALSTIYMLLTAIILGIIGAGAPSAGLSYIAKNFAADTHTFVFSDFFDKYKSNFFQATLVFIIDVAVVLVGGFAYIFYTIKGGVMGIILKTIIIIAATLFAMMHMYIYSIMVSFKLKVRDIYKNAFFLVMARLWWNLFAFCVSAVIIYAVMVFTTSSPFGFALLLGLYLPVLSFTQIFMTKNVLYEILTKPSLERENQKRG